MNTTFNNNKISLLLVLILLTFIILTPQVQSKGKTYEDLEEIIKETNSESLFKDKQATLTQPIVKPVAQAPAPQTQNKQQQTTPMKTTPPLTQVNTTANKNTSSTIIPLQKSKVDAKKKETQTKDLVKQQYVNQLDQKQKKKSKNDHMMVNDVTISKPKNKRDDLMFFLQLGMLLLAIFTIIGVCIGFAFIIYRLIRINREQYFQFNDNVPPLPQDIEKNTVLPTIKEVNEQDSVVQGVPNNLERKITQDSNDFASASTKNNRSDVNKVDNWDM